ncbi:MAG: polyprenyl synthetase family protein [Candidatus Firestonebacteria bacterium]|nr:polyprenyl synthetase family protein [Candidatus Firestonebacteria bacterium]
MIMELFTSVKPELEEVEKLLQEKVSANVKHIEGATTYILSAGGKRLRPILSILVSQLGSFNRERAVKIAYVVEYIHMASLIHDDIIDNAAKRRGRPSTNAKFGNHYCVLLGDYLFSKSLFDLSIYEKGNINSVILKATNEMCEGQILQVLLNRKINITEEEYYEVIRTKTGALIAGGCKAAGLSSGQSEESSGKLWHFGMNIGIAFQITDDILDVISTSQKLGKPAGSDAREGNYTLPLIYTLNSANSVDKETILKLLSNMEMNDSDWERLKSFIEKYNGVKYAQDAGKKYVESAKNSLKDFPDCKAKHILEKAADYCIERTY